MSRVTVEDSLKNVDNRFSLVLLASKRARDLMMTGTAAEVADEGDDKCTVLALREIAAGKIKQDYLLKESPKIVKPEPTYAAEEEDFDLDDESNAALIAALSDVADENASEEGESEATVDAEVEN